jgi:hypothetical protein
LVQTFSTNYGFNAFPTGLVQLAISIGTLIGMIVNPFQNLLYFRTAKRNSERHRKPIPEARLCTAVSGSLLFTASSFRFGWTSSPQIHWIVSTAGITCVGFVIYSIYVGTVNYMMDAYEKYAATALSAASLGRKSLGAFLRLASYSLFRNLGPGWAGSLLGFIGLALTAVQVLLISKGPEIRHRSSFMLEASYDHGEGYERKGLWAAG